MTPIGWLLGNDTGISSKTIFAVMMGEDVINYFGPGVPQDPADFGRCHRLLFHFPAWRARLPEVSAKYPAWGPLIREWSFLTAMFMENEAQGITRMKDLYDKMQTLIDEGQGMSR